MKGHSSPPNIYEHLGAKAPGWTPFSPAVANAIRRALPERQRMYAASCGLLLGLIFRKQRQFQSEWVELSYPIIAEEIAGSTETAKKVVALVCVGKSPSLEVVAKRSGDRDNANQYTFIHNNIHSFWQMHGPQPALQNGQQDVFPTGLQAAMLTRLIHGLPLHKQETRLLTQMKREANSLFLLPDGEKEVQDVLNDEISQRCAAITALQTAGLKDDDEESIVRLSQMPDILWWYLAAVRLPSHRAELVRRIKKENREDSWELIVKGAKNHEDVRTNCV